MTSFSWATAMQQWEWSCPGCTATWKLYPVAGAHLDDIKEVAVHSGGQRKVGVRHEHCAQCRVHWWCVVA